MRTQQSGFSTLPFIIGVIIALVIVGVLVLGSHKSSPKITTSLSSSGCVSQTLKTGASGSCVSDAQNLVNWGAFGIDGPNYIKTTGTFDATTESAVKTFQKNMGLAITGTISSKDWQALCQISDAPSAITAAAKAAGC